MYDGPADDVASSVIETMGKDIIVVGHMGAQNRGYNEIFWSGFKGFTLSKSNRLPIQVLSLRLIPNPSARDYWSLCPIGNPIPTEISQYMGSNQSDNHNGGLSKNLHFRRLLIKIHLQNGIYFSHSAL